MEQAAIADNALAHSASVYYSGSRLNSLSLEGLLKLLTPSLDSSSVGGCAFFLLQFFLVCIWTAFLAAGWKAGAAVHAAGAHYWAWRCGREELSIPFSSPSFSDAPIHMTAVNLAVHTFAFATASS